MVLIIITEINTESSLVAFVQNKYYMAHATAMSSSNCIEINVVLIAIHSITLRDYFNSSELLCYLKDTCFPPQANHHLF